MRRRANTFGTGSGGPAICDGEFFMVKSDFYNSEEECAATHLKATVEGQKQLLSVRPIILAVSG